MRVFVLDRALGDQHSGLLQRLDGGEVALPHFAVLVVDFESREERHVRAEAPVVGDVVGDFNFMRICEIVS